MCSCHQAFVLTVYQEEWPQLAAVMRMMGFAVKCSIVCAVVQQVMLQQHILLQAHIPLIECCAQPHARHQGWASDRTLNEALLKQPKPLYRVA